MTPGTEFVMLRCGVTTRVTREQAIDWLNVDEFEFDWAIEEDGVCTGLDAEGVPVEVTAN